MEGKVQYSKTGMIISSCKFMKKVLISSVLRMTNWGQYAAGEGVVKGNLQETLNKEYDESKNAYDRQIL